MVSYFVRLNKFRITGFALGSAFVPIKKRDFRDGIYSLQIRSIAIMLVGLVSYVWSGYPPFYPIAMIGGMLWAVANLIVLPCIGQLGLGMTVLLYSTTNCLTNWFTGKLNKVCFHIPLSKSTFCVFELQNICRFCSLDELKKRPKTKVQIF
jgi:hypothetical protein